MNGLEINHLADLLKSCDSTRNDSDSEDEQPKKSSVANLTPASIVSQVTKTTDSIKSTNETSQTDSKVSNRKSKDIWQIDEVPEANTKVFDFNDNRPQPEYEMHFKQRVTTEDVFLQMGNKNCASASCEDLVVNIQLPETKLSEIVLDVTKTSLDCRCPKYRLLLQLPHPVDSDNSQAKWDKEKCLLTVTLRMIREFDDFNF